MKQMTEEMIKKGVLKVGLGIEVEKDLDPEVNMSYNFNKSIKGRC